MRIYFDFSKIQEVLPMIQKLSRSKGISYTYNIVKCNGISCLGMVTNEHTSEIEFEWGTSGSFENNPIYRKVWFDEFWHTLCWN